MRRRISPMHALLAAMAAAAVLGATSDEKKPDPPPEPPKPKPPTPGNPPPPGTLLKQSEVTPAMTAFAKEVLHSTTPMHGVVARSFPEGSVLARVEWHDYQAATGKHGTFRGVTLYWPV